MGNTSPRSANTASAAPRLLDQVRARIGVKHYSLRTGQTCVGWVRRFILFHCKRHPRDMGAPEVEAFLSHLAADRTVCASARNQALAALLFLYREVLGIELPWLDGVTRDGLCARPESGRPWRGQSAGSLTTSNLSVNSIRGIT